MAKRQEWTVRVVVTKEALIERIGNTRELPGIWIEQLRYMGHAQELATFDNPERSVIEFYCPLKGADTKVWADQNASRMRSFGIDAAAAPKWASGETELRALCGDRTAGLQTHMERLNRGRS